MSHNATFSLDGGTPMDYCRDRSLGVAEATEMIRGIAKFGTVVQSDHCEYERMPERNLPPPRCSVYS